MARTSFRRAASGLLIAIIVLMTASTNAVPSEAQSRSLRWYPSYLPDGLTLEYVTGPAATPPIPPGPGAWVESAKRVILAPPGSALNDINRVSLLIGYPGAPGVIPNLTTGNPLLAIDDLKPSEIPPTGATYPPGFAPAFRTGEFELGSCGKAYAMGLSINTVSAMKSLSCTLDASGRPVVGDYPSWLAVLFAGRYTVLPNRGVYVSYADKSTGTRMSISGGMYPESTNPADLAKVDTAETTIGSWPAWVSVSSSGANPPSSSISVLVAPAIRYDVSANLDVSTLTRIVRSLTELSPSEWKTRTGSVDLSSAITVAQPAAPPTPITLPETSPATRTIPTSDPLSATSAPITEPPIASNGGVCSFLDRTMVERVLRQPVVRAVSESLNGQPGCTVVGKNGVVLSVSSRPLAGTKTAVAAAIRKKLRSGVAWSDSSTKSYGYVRGNVAIGGDGQHIATVAAFASPGGKSTRRRVSFDGDVAITMAANVLRQQRTGPVADAARLP
jgi:hypothetical protein